MRPIPTWLRYVAKGAIVTLAVYLAYRFSSQTGWRELGSRMAQAHPGYLGAAIAAMVARWLFWQHRWGLGLAVLGERSRTHRRFTALMGSVLANHITPSMRIVGGIFRTRYITRSSQAGFARLYGGVLFDQVAQNATATLATWIALILTWWQMDRRLLAAAAAAVLVSALGVILHRARSAGSLRDHPLVELLVAQARKQTSRLQPLLEKGKEAVAAFMQLLLEPRIRLPAFLLSLGFIAGNIAGQWLIFRALGFDASLVVVVSVVGLGTLVGIATGSPGGFGTTEAAMIALYGSLGIVRLEAVAATLLYRGLHYALVLVLGAPTLLYYELLDPHRPR